MGIVKRAVWWLMDFLCALTGHYHGCALLNDGWTSRVWLWGASWQCPRCDEPIERCEGHA